MQNYWGGCATGRLKEGHATTDVRNNRSDCTCHSEWMSELFQSCIQTLYGLVLLIAVVEDCQLEVVSLHIL